MRRTLIIAEAGVNHNGDISNAKSLIEKAKECGADIIKFQAFVPNRLASKYAIMADYQKKNLNMNEPQEEMLERLALKNHDFIILAQYCEKVGIRFLCSPFDLESISFLADLQDMWKIPSGEITNYPYLVEIGKSGKDILLSTGMCTLDEVDSAIAVLKESGAGAITLLHCTTNYPTPVNEVNLNAMLTLRNHCKLPVGYSDHTIGIEVPIAAVAMGAVVIEKHFTLDRSMIGPDHKASLEPVELKDMITSIRNIENALGDGKKIPSASEKQNITVVRKSIMASKRIKNGEVFTKENLTTKRPGTGIDPMRWNDVIGKKATKDYEIDEMIEL